MNNTDKILLSKVKGVIYDLDGTLVSSTLDFALIRRQLNCPNGVDTLKFIAAMEDPKQQAAAHALVAQHELDDAFSATWLPGAKQLVTALKAKNLPQAIVTRNNQSASQIKVSNNQIPITTIISREHYPPKPAPDALLAIAKQWQISPAEIIYVGDFLYDIQAGNNAGMISCLITNGRTADYAATADLVFEQLSKLYSCWIKND